MALLFPACPPDAAACVQNKRAATQTTPERRTKARAFLRLRVSFLRLRISVGLKLRIAFIALARLAGARRKTRP
ncbi:MAG: hypothetical protein DMF66_18530 [Acidobacteria bacterium]|nr:MAG: hypothetical protein DMF66_18530 [Acidobacteriota bacterium]